MKKIFFLVLSSVFLLTACLPQNAQKKDSSDTYNNINLSSPQAQTPEITTWLTYTDRKITGFSLLYPDYWQANCGGDIECATICNIGDIPLIIFGACWKDYVDGPKLTLQQTYDRFKKAYPPTEAISKLNIYDRNIELINYANSGDNGIFSLTEGSAGTIALWHNTKNGFALIDEGSKHQTDGIFTKVLESFSYSNTKEQGP